MKKIFAIVAAAATLAAATVLTTSCNKGDEGDDYYKIKEIFDEDQQSYLEPVTKIYQEKYHNKEWKSRAEAQKVWAEAEAAFKAVENQLRAGDKGFVSYSMNRYSLQGSSFEVAECIGTWCFPAAN